MRWAKENTSLQIGAVKHYDQKHDVLGTRDLSHLALLHQAIVKSLHNEITCAPSIWQMRN